MFDRIINSIFKGGSTRHLVLERDTPTVFVEGRTHGFQTVIRITEAEGMPKEVFVFQRTPFVDPITGTQDRFSNVAKPTDLEELGIGDVLDPTRPYYRLAEMALIFDSLDELNDGVEALYTDLAGLVETLNFNDTLALKETVLIGAQPVPSSSSSSSSSLSSSSSP
jgi:hypothetical protein